MNKVEQLLCEVEKSGIMGGAISWVAVQRTSSDSSTSFRVDNEDGEYTFMITIDRKIQSLEDISSSKPEPCKFYVLELDEDVPATVQRVGKFLRVYYTIDGRDIIHMYNIDTTSDTEYIEIR